jgi:hypothetical protein
MPDPAFVVLLAVKMAGAAAVVVTASIVAGGPAR